MEEEEEEGAWGWFAVAVDCDSPPTGKPWEEEEEVTHEGGPNEEASMAVDARVR